MGLNLLKRLAALLPASWQHELRRVYFRRQIRHRRFMTDEKEFGFLDSFLQPGDWALDIGANVGHYTNRMSELVGPSGRVVALEPVPETFALLAGNARLFRHENVSLLNVAASDQVAAVGMQIPRFSDGLTNFYQARLASNGNGLAVLTLPVDALSLPAIRLVKIDVEGHELPVLRGMRMLLDRDHPVMIVETGAQETLDLLNGLGYTIERLPGSSNVLCRHSRQ
jgi:FkbM family methyltransferase